MKNLSVTELAWSELAILVIPDIPQSDPKLSIDSIEQAH